MKLTYMLLTGLCSILSVCIVAQSAYYFPAQNYGGRDAYKDLLKNEMIYPDDARKNDVEGNVKLTFTVNENGETAYVKIAESVCKSIDHEALRLFNHLLWSPARAKGTTITENLDIEIEFKLRKYKKVIKRRGYDEPVYPVLPVDESLKVYEIKQLDTAPKPVYTNEVEKFGDFIIQNLKYPDAAKRQGISGTVELFFVVEPSGNISNYKIENSVGAGCNEEAIRILKLLKWIPGIKNGMAVRTAMMLNITFNIEDSENMRYVPANNANQI